MTPRTYKALEAASFGAFVLALYGWMMLGAPL